MAGKKTGIYLSPVSEEIVNKVAEKYGYTKLSSIVNFIISEYDKLVNQKQAVVEVKEKQEDTKPDFDGWFVAEGKQ